MHDFFYPTTNSSFSPSSTPTSKIATQHGFEDGHTQDLASRTIRSPGQLAKPFGGCTRPGVSTPLAVVGSLGAAKHGRASLPVPPCDNTKNLPAPISRFFRTESLVIFALSLFNHAIQGLGCGTDLMAFRTEKRVERLAYVATRSDELIFNVVGPLNRSRQIFLALSVIRRSMWSQWLQRQCKFPSMEYNMMSTVDLTQPRQHKSPLLEVLLVIQTGPRLDTTDRRACLSDKRNVLHSGDSLPFILATKLRLPSPASIARKCLPKVFTLKKIPRMLSLKLISSFRPKSQPTGSTKALPATLDVRYCHLRVSRHRKIREITIPNLLKRSVALRSATHLAGEMA